MSDDKESKQSFRDKLQKEVHKGMLEGVAVGVVTQGLPGIGTGIFGGAAKGVVSATFQTLTEPNQTTNKR